MFCGFTLSQFGMVVHHRRLQEPGWKRNQVINMVGAIATFVVLIVVVVSKFSHGAWIPVVLIPLIVLGFRKIKRHYDHVADGAEGRTDRTGRAPLAHRRRAVGSVNKGVLNAVAYARSMRPDRLVAISVVTDAEEESRVVDAWEQFEMPVELRTVFSPYRDLTNPILEVIDELDAERPDDVDHRGDPRVRRRALVGPGAAQPERRRAALEAAPAPEHGDHADPRPDRPHRHADTTHQRSTGGRHMTDEAHPTPLHAIIVGCGRVGAGMARRLTRRRGTR